MMHSVVSPDNSVPVFGTDFLEREPLELGRWQALYEQYSRYVYYLALRMVGERALAEDITHDVFLKAFRNLDRFRGHSSLRTWLYRITVNQCHNVQRAWNNRNIITTGDTRRWDGVAA